MNLIIEMNDIHKTFGRQDAAVEALKGVSLQVAEGELLAIMGKSGSGKSTLLNILGGLMTMTDGQVIYKGKMINFQSKRELTRYRRSEVGFIVQYFALINDLNVFDNVALPLRYQGISRREIRRRVRQVLEELGIADKERSYPSQLSGGQQQRVSIARAIVKNPQIILADEPTGALDENTGNEVMEIFHRLRENGKTIVIVTHDDKIAAECDRTVYLKDGMELMQPSLGA